MPQWGRGAVVLRQCPATIELGSPWCLTTCHCRASKRERKCAKMKEREREGESRSCHHHHTQSASLSLELITITGGSHHRHCHRSHCLHLFLSLISVFYSPSCVLKSLLLWWSPWGCLYLNEANIVATSFLCSFRVLVSCPCSKTLIVIVLFSWLIENFEILFH
ncbi:hypothetical protein AHAS_Ahas07G0091100 [Arachis hypogaea]